MKRIFAALLLWLPLAALGQAAAPAWIDNAHRAANYPAEAWYTGFVRDNLKPGANAATALKMLEREAQNQLAESIIVTIDARTQTETSSQRYQGGGGQSAEAIVTDYKQAVRTATTATTVKTDLQSYHDASTGKIYAFAAVKRSDLAAFYRKQITVDLNKAEIAVGVCEQLVASGKKMSGRRKVEEAKGVLGGVSFYRDMLVAVDADTDENGLQTARGGELQRTVEKMLIDLEQSTFVYIECTHEIKGTKDDAFSYDPGIISEIIKQTLSENGCSITDNKDEADYELTLVTSTTQRSDGTGQYGLLSYYANVRGNLYNRLTKKKTVDFAFINDPDAYSAGRSAEDAATKAFKRPEFTSKVVGKILPKIKD